MIAVSDLSRTFAGPPDLQVLTEVNLTVERGDYLAIVGPSGSGKSTFLNLLGLLDLPTSGSYLLDGISTVGLTEAQRTALRGRRIGFVFQEFHLLAYRTATENVAMGMLYSARNPALRNSRARETLQRVGLEHRMNSLPTTLSGGERQRVAIARALVGDPTLLLCDEPTGSLDSATAKQVLDLFDQLNGEGVTIVVITHDPVTAHRARRQIRLDDGRVSTGE